MVLNFLLYNKRIFFDTDRYIYILYIHIRNARRILASFSLALLAIIFMVDNMKPDLKIPWYKSKYSFYMVIQRAKKYHVCLGQ